jgi:hypothetical protein
MIMSAHRFLRTTALSLILASSNLASATNITLKDTDWIGEGESLSSIANKGVRLLQTEKGDMQIGAPLTKTLNFSYSYGTEAAESDLLDVKNKVISSEQWVYPDTFENYAKASKQKIKNAFNRPPLNQVNNYSDFVDNVSVKIFKASQRDLITSKNRGERIKDNTLGALITFTRNKNEKVSVFIEDLGILLPLFSNHRLIDPKNPLDGLTPYGASLSSDQKVTAQFMNRLLLEMPSAFKKGLSYRVQNPKASIEDLWNSVTGLNSVMTALKLVPGTKDWLIDQVRASRAFEGRYHLPREEKIRTTATMFSFLAQERENENPTLDLLRFSIFKAYELGGGDFDIGFGLYRFMNPAFSLMNQVRESNVFERSLSETEKARRVRMVWDFSTNKGQQETDIDSLKTAIKRATSLIEKGDFNIGFDYYQIMSPDFYVMDNVRSSKVFDLNLPRAEKIGRTRLMWDFLTHEGEKKTHIDPMKTAILEVTKLNAENFDLGFKAYQQQLKTLELANNEPNLFDIANKSLQVNPLSLMDESLNLSPITTRSLVEQSVQVNPNSLNGGGNPDMGYVQQFLNGNLQGSFHLSQVPIDESVYLSEEEGVEQSVVVSELHQ